MKTNQMMKRPLLGSEITQRSDNGFFSATDLVRVGNLWRSENALPAFNPGEYFRAKSTKDFVMTLEAKYGKSKYDSKGKGHHTWVHPLLFIDMALTISPKLKLEVYEWLYDHLINYRNESGDSYNQMCGALYANYPNKREFHLFIVKVADAVRKTCGVDDWQRASEEQLLMRDTIHKEIAVLASVIRDNNAAVRAALGRAMATKKMPRRNQTGAKSHVESSNTSTNIHRIA